jgi:hypothetical protein
MKYFIRCSIFDAFFGEFELDLISLSFYFISLSCYDPISSPICLSLVLKETYRMPLKTFFRSNL